MIEAQRYETTLHHEYHFDGLIKMTQAMLGKLWRNAILLKQHFFRSFIRELSSNPDAGTTRTNRPYRKKMSC